MDHKEYRLAAIMFTDIVGFSRMMEKDEAGTLKLMEFHNELVRRRVESFGGKIIKTIGDAFLTEFPNANNAVRCAIEVQRELEAHNQTKPANPLVLRIGVHLGDIYFFENDALGEGINIASRLQSLCRPGRICISQEVHNLVSNKIEIPIKPLGAVTLKNISRGIHAYEIMTNGSADPLQDEDENTAPAEQFPSPVSSGNVPLPTPDSDSGTLASHGQTGGSGPSVLSESETKDVRSQVMSLIKQAGRRLTVPEVRGRIKQSGPAVDAYLEKLADSGFIVRSGPDIGSSASDARSSARFGSGEEAEDSRDSWRDFGRRRDHYGRHSGEVFGEIAREIKSEIVDRVQNAIEFGTFSKKVPSFEQYLEQAEKKLAKEKEGFRSHLSSYIGVNIMLWAIWAFTMAGGFLWPLIVTFSWGIGMASHWVAKRDSEREVKILKALPPLETKPFALLRKLFKERRGWNGHLVSNIATSVLLVVINLLTTAFPWAVFPIGAMAIGLFAHLPAFKRKEQDLLNQLNQEGVPVDLLVGSEAALKDIADMKYTKGVGPIGLEAERIRGRIIRQVRAMKGKHPLGSDFIPIIDNYVKQINELSVRDKEIDIILRTIPLQDLDKEREQVVAELAKTTDPRLRAEYEKSVEQIGKQKRAYDEMQSEQKVLKIRLNNALNSLKQLELDLARMRSMSTGQEVGAADVIKAKSNELSEYLNDLKAGYQEIEAMEGSPTTGSRSVPKSENSGDRLDEAFKSLERNAAHLPGFDQPIARSAPETEKSVNKPADEK